MGRVIVLLLIVLLLTAPFSAAGQVSERVGIISVKGMVCSSCTTAVSKALTRLPGVKAVSVDMKKNLVTVDYDQRKITVPQMISAIRKAGFKADLPR